MGKYNEDDVIDFSDDGGSHSEAEHTKKPKKKSGGFQSMGMNRFQETVFLIDCLGLDSALFNAIVKKGFRVPTPIQRKTIPIVMQGKYLIYCDSKFDLRSKGRMLLRWLERVLVKPRLSSSP